MQSPGTEQALPQPYPQLYLSTSGPNVADWYSEQPTVGCWEAGQKVKYSCPWRPHFPSCVGTIFFFESPDMLLCDHGRKWQLNNILVLRILFFEPWWALVLFTPRADSVVSGSSRNSRRQEKAPCLAEPSSQGCTLPLSFPIHLAV